MARIRTIKPEFWQDEDLASVSEPSLLLAIGLLNASDDEGYFKAHHGLIKAAIFPLREPSLSIHGMITELSNICYIQLFKGSDGKDYGQVVNFSSHQRINRPTPSKIKELTSLTECSLSDHGGLTAGKERNGKEGKGSDKPQKKFTKPSLEEIKAYCQERDRGVNPDKWFNHYSANGWKVGKNPMKDWKAAIRTWEEAPGDEPEKQWHETSAGVILKASETDVIPVEGEPIGILKQRVADKLGITL